MSAQISFVAVGPKRRCYILGHNIIGNFNQFLKAMSYSGKFHCISLVYLGLSAGLKRRTHSALPRSMCYHSTPMIGLPELRWHPPLNWRRGNGWNGIGWKLLREHFEHYKFHLLRQIQKQQAYVSCVCVLFTVHRIGKNRSKTVQQTSHQLRTRRHICSAR